MSGPESSPVGNIAAAYELTLRQREFEISQLTQRNNFFMIFQGVIIGGLVQSGGSAAPILTFSICALGLVVSIYQTAMAAGAKFWQVRWERATRQLEVWLLQELKDHKKVFQLFSSDPKFLSTSEEQALEDVNKAAARLDDPLNMQPGLIKQWVEQDIRAGADHWLLDRITSRLILWKPSVSRIPIKVGIALVVFWLVLLAHTLAGSAPNLADILHLVPFIKT